MAFYPNIRDDIVTALNVVVLNMRKDPEYLNNPSCPYSPELKEFFRGRTGPGSDDNGPPIDLFRSDDASISDVEMLDKQAMALINDLERWGSKLTAAENSEKMGYFRTKTALMEKLVNMRSDIVNIKQINDFKNTILDFMSETLTKDQITALMERLDGVMGISNDNL